jgi:hypothetical protein
MNFFLTEFGRRHLSLYGGEVMSALIVLFSLYVGEGDHWETHMRSEMQVPSSVADVLTLLK